MPAHIKQGKKLTRLPLHKLPLLRLCCGMAALRGCFTNNTFAAASTVRRHVRIRGCTPSTLVKPRSCSAALRVCLVNNTLAAASRVQRHVRVRGPHTVKARQAQESQRREPCWRTEVVVRQCTRGRAAAGAPVLQPALHSGYRVLGVYPASTFPHMLMQPQPFKGSITHPVGPARPMAVYIACAAKCSQPERSLHTSYVTHRKTTQAQGPQLRGRQPRRNGRLQQPRWPRDAQR